MVTAQELLTLLTQDHVRKRDVVKVVLIYTTNYFKRPSMYHKLLKARQIHHELLKTPLHTEYTTEY